MTKASLFILKLSTALCIKAVQSNHFSEIGKNMSLQDGVIKLIVGANMA